jgi:hypothetical protein
MKNRFLLLASFTAAHLITSAQLTKGCYLLGGTANGSIQGYSQTLSGSAVSYTSNAHSYSFGIAPEAGKFVRDRLALGISPDLGFGAFYFSGTKTPFYSLGTGLFMRGYFGKNDHLKIFVHEAAGYEYEHQNNHAYNGNEVITYRSETNTLRENISLGAAWFVRPDISLDVMWGIDGGVSHYQSFEPGGYNNNTLTTRYFSFPLKVGLQVYLCPPARSE